MSPKLKAFGWALLTVGLIVCGLFTVQVSILVVEHFTGIRAGVLDSVLQGSLIGAAIYCIYQAVLEKQVEEARRG